MKLWLISIYYKYVLKTVLFRFDPEFVHDMFTRHSYTLGRHFLSKKLLEMIFLYKHPKLEQTLFGLNFRNPIGLAAGFDYDAKISGVLSSIGFGFFTAGTVTNIPYEGNPRPRLGRLPKSKSLLVNKGFKSSGATAVISLLNGKPYEVPLGISIGRSNSRKLTTLEESILDIVTTFRSFEKSSVNHAYYELNISCPNLIHGNESITFYPAANLDLLLNSVDALKIPRPIFVKMPITESDSDVLDMLNVIVRHNIQGVIFGNLEKNRENPLLNAKELKKVGKGNFSGKPCYERSNELISLTYKKYSDSLTIIGVGGIFSAQDAYEKIKSGATLVQLITGLVYEGPQIVGSINRDLVRMLQDDNCKNISDAIGLYHK